jgi:undecaprenyl-diphosphatase
MNELLELDKKILLWLNGFHSPSIDAVMMLMTKTIFWLPLYLVLAYIIFKRFKLEGWFVLAAAGISILLADQITSGFMKPFFARLRPSHEPGLEGLLHLVNGYKGGRYGFASSHAANTFAVAFLIWCVFRDVSQWAGLIFIWAIIMSYTRIYLGVHYPGDIIAGALVGILCGWPGFKFFQWLREQREKRKTPSSST